MAADKKSNSRVEGKNSGVVESAKVADIYVASKTLADAADFSRGYPDTMPLHINGGRQKGSK